VCNPSASDSIAAHRVELVRSDTEVLQHLSGVFAELRNVRRDFIAVHPRHFDGGTENCTFGLSHEHFEIRIADFMATILYRYWSKPPPN
jgi:hypothetical protein